MRRTPNSGGTAACSQNRSALRKADNKSALLRRVGVKWLEENQSEVMWSGMTVSRLCRIVSGMTFPEYLQKMRGDGESIDTVFLHALGLAHGVTVLIIQAGMDAGIVGLDVVEDAVMEGRGRAMVVPVALQND